MQAAQGIDEYHEEELAEGGIKGLQDYCLQLWTRMIATIIKIKVQLSIEHMGQWRRAYFPDNIDSMWKFKWAI